MHPCAIIINLLDCISSKCISGWKIISIHRKFMRIFIGEYEDPWLISNLFTFITDIEECFGSRMVKSSRISKSSRSHSKNQQNIQHGIDNSRCENEVFFLFQKVLFHIASSTIADFNQFFCDLVMRFCLMVNLAVRITLPFGHIQSRKA